VAAVGGAGQASPHASTRPVMFAVARVRPDGRFTYTTPHWPDARRYLVGLLEQHAAAATAAAALDVARRARTAASQVPAVPPAYAWRVQLGDTRYELRRQDLGAPGHPDTPEATP
jgi:hypothetical protein